MRTVRSKAGDSVNRLIYRETGRSDDEAEAAFWALNPGLAEHGPVLPSGVVVTLPDLPVEREVETAATVWD